MSCCNSGRELTYVDCCCDQRKSRCSCDRKRSNVDPIYAESPPNVAGTYSLKNVRGVLGPNANIAVGACFPTTDSVLSIIPVQQEQGCNSGYQVSLVNGEGQVTTNGIAVWVYNKANGWHLVLSSIDENVDADPFNFFFDRVSGSGEVHFHYSKHGYKYRLDKLSLNIALKVEITVILSGEVIQLMDSVAVSAFGSPRAAAAMSVSKAHLPPRGAGRARTARHQHVASHEEGRRLLARKERAFMAALK